MTGFSAILADRRTPWGTDVESTRYATSTEMLEIAGLAGLNVQLRPEYTLDHDNQMVQIPGRYATVTSSGKVLGSGLSQRYRVLQMEDAFGFGDAMVDSGEASWSRAGQLRGGETAFGCMELTHLDITVPGDDGGALKPYLLVINSFGGWSPYQGIITFIRPRCINTFQAAKGTKTPHRFSIRHTGTLDGKLQMAREALGIAFKHAAEVKELVGALSTQKVVERQVRTILASAWPAESKDPKAVSMSAQKAMELYQTSETLDGIRGTAWGVLNAVTEYVDHVAEYRPRDGGDAAQLRTLNILLDNGEAAKERALAAILRIR